MTAKYLQLRKKSRFAFLVIILFCFHLSNGAAESTSPPAAPAKNSGWFPKLNILKMGNAVTRAMTYSISKNESKAIAVLEFGKDSHPLSWFRLDDGVMGGKSETLHLAKDDTLHFEGQINTNGGGFASIRAKVPPGIFAGDTTVKGIRIRYRGDGKTYKVLMGNGERGGPFSRVPSWQADLPTEDKTESRKWDEATILFENLLPAFGGGRQPSEEEKKQYTFDAAEVKEIGFMLSLRLSDGSPNPKETFGEGIFPFSLVIQSMAMV